MAGLVRSLATATAVLAVQEVPLDGVFKLVAYNFEKHIPVPLGAEPEFPRLQARRRSLLV
jgi:hypothetical protein